MPGSDSADQQQTGDRLVDHTCGARALSLVRVDLLVNVNQVRLDMLSADH